MPCSNTIIGVVAASLAFSLATNAAECGRGTVEANGVCVIAAPSVEGMGVNGLSMSVPGATLTLKSHGCPEKLCVGDTVEIVDGACQAIADDSNSVSSELKAALLVLTTAFSAREAEREKTIQDAVDEQVARMNATIDRYTELAESRTQMQLPFAEDSDSEDCVVGDMGLLRFHKDDLIMQVCSGESWLAVGSATTENSFEGTTMQKAATSCNQIMRDNSVAPNGIYWLTPGGVAAKKHYCKRGNGGEGYTLLMKMGPNRDLFYDSEYWTNTETLNEDDVADVFARNAKYDAFNHLGISKLMLVTPHGSSVLGLTKEAGTPLASLFAGGHSQKLTFISGISRPTKLMGGSDYGSQCGHPWRLESWAASQNFKVRIGGFHASHWDCSYGTDQNGDVTGASLAGFGFHDQTWSGFVHAKGSAGIRQAHDYAPHTLTGAQIWGL